MLQEVGRCIVFANFHQKLVVAFLKMETFVWGIEFLAISVSSIAAIIMTAMHRVANPTATREEEGDTIRLNSTPRRLVCEMTRHSSRFFV